MNKTYPKRTRCKYGHEYRDHPDGRPLSYFWKPQKNSGIQQRWCLVCPRSPVARMAQPVWVEPAPEIKYLPFTWSPGVG